MLVRLTIFLTIVFGLLPTATKATTFTDPFTDNTFTQQHWTFFDLDTVTLATGPATGISGGGELAVSSPAAENPHFAFAVVGDLGGSIAFDEPVTRVRGGVRWTQEQLDSRLGKAIVVRGNFGELNAYYLNMDPGSVGDNFFSLRIFVGGVSTLLAPGGSPGVYQADVDYNFEFQVDGDALSARLWTGNNYDTPIFTVAATDTQLPSGAADGNVLAGMISAYAGDNGPGAIVDSILLPNSQFGGVFDVAVPEPSTVVLAAMGLVGLTAFGWRQRKGSHYFSPLSRAAW